MSTFFERLTKNSEQEKLQEQEKERQMKHWVAIEKVRKKREAYEVKEIPDWITLGVFWGIGLTILTYLAVWLLDLNDPIFLWIMGFGISPLILFGVTSQIESTWKVSFDAKEKINQTDNDSIQEDENLSPFSDFSVRSETKILNGFEYKYGYLYTDNIATLWFYLLAKFIMGFLTIAIYLTIFAAIITLALMFKGTFTIAPTTIIIILLIIIIFNQNKN